MTGIVFCRKTLRALATLKLGEWLPVTSDRRGKIRIAACVLASLSVSELPLCATAEDATAALASLS